MLHRAWQAEKEALKQRRLQQEAAAKEREAAAKAAAAAARAEEHRKRVEERKAKYVSAPCWLATGHTAAGSAPFRDVVLMVIMIGNTSADSMPWRHFDISAPCSGTQVAAGCSKCVCFLLGACCQQWWATIVH